MVSTVGCSTRANDKCERVGTEEQSDDAEMGSDHYSGEVVNPSLLGPIQSPQ